MSDFDRPSGPPPVDPFASDSRPLHDRWIVDRLMPEREVHLLAGAAGAGKTTLAMQILSAIQSGTDVFGYRTHPTKVVIVSNDRSVASHSRMIDGMSVPADRFQFFSQRNRFADIETIVKNCAMSYPGCRLIFIDGFATLVPNGKLSDYNEVANFLRRCGRLCEDYNMTILGSVHATKTKEGERFPNPRQRVLGSVAWAGFSDLILVVDPAKPDDPNDPFRIVSVLPRNAGEFNLRFRRENGLLIPVDEAIEADLLSLLDFWLLGQSFDREFPTREVLQEAKKHTIPERSAERWLEKACDGGRVARVRKGLYKPLRLS